MNRLIAAAAALALLGACGDGNTFTNDPTEGGVGGGGGDTAGIPENISDDLDAFTYNPATDTLTITGVFLDDEASTVTYARTPSLDVPGYVAYSVQEAPLDQHVTAYAQSISSVTGAMAVSGGQFTFYNGGVGYTRSGGFDPQDVTPDTGLVTYAGDYIGITNIGSVDGTELAPVPPGTSDSIRPRQASTVTGSIFINADFIDNTVKGTVYDRVFRPSNGAAAVPLGPDGDLNLVPTEITADGTFAGDVQVAPSGDRQTVGEYGFIFGGTNSDAVACGLYVEEHMGPGFGDEEEYGLFVLGRCGTPVGTSPLCPTVGE